MVRPLVRPLMRTLREADVGKEIGRKEDHVWVVFHFRTLEISLPHGMNNFMYP